ncbi:MAG: AAA family ATPase [Xanthomonadaceae bacterium]|nr:AAA family ATPase [Xanthomonadaceae bacterium]
MDSDKRLSQNKVALQAGISPTTLSQWLGGNYAGNNESVEAKLQRWLETTQAARAQADQMPAAPRYVKTPTAECVITTMRYAQMAGDIAIVYGGAGLGKTAAAMEYARRAPNVWLATMTPASAGVVPSLQVIAEALGLLNVPSGANNLHAAICRRVKDTNGLIVIDDAHVLSENALDQIRAINDSTQVALVLIGNERAYARMTGGNRAAYLDRLYSRIGKKLPLRKSAPADIAALLDAWMVEDAKARAQLTDIAGKGGGLRTMTKVLRLASLYATAEKRDLNSDDVRAAWRELGGVE